MSKRILAILCAFTLLLVVPARAAEIIDPDEMPVQGPLSSERTLEVFTLNGQPFGVARATLAYGENPEDVRVHFVWHDLGAAGAIVTTQEFILVAGIAYERRNNEQRWRAGPINQEGSPVGRDFEVFYAKLPPATFPEDFTITYVGDMAVDGVQAGQYQLALRSEKTPDDVNFVKEDLFFQRTSNNGVENYLFKGHTTLSMTNAAGETDLLEYVRSWYDPSMPVTIEAPPSDLVDMVGVEALTATFPGAQYLPVWARGPTARVLTDLHGGY